MELTRSGDDFQSCEHGWSRGQALCAGELDLFFNVRKAKVIEVIPKLRPGKDRVRIARGGVCALHIDGEWWCLYSRTVAVAEHWIYKGYNYVQIEVLE